MNRLKISKRFILLSLLLAVTLAPARVAGPEMGTLRGVVTGWEGVPVSEASVLIQYWKKLDKLGTHWVPVQVETVYTDSEGRFSVQLQPELYDVFISDISSSPFAKKVMIEAEKVTTLDCELHRDPLIELVE